MNDLPQTEARNPQTEGLDQLSTADLVVLLASEQRAAADAVLAVANELARAADEIADRLRDGGRLHYIGAGSSGRLGVLDAAEIPPTFSTDPSLVCAHIAGGPAALTRAIEDAEDDAEAGAREMREHVQSADAVVGLSASGSARYAVQGIRAARELGAWTLGVCNTPDAPLVHAADLAIVLKTGPEAVAGSTRLKAGTAQKILLNALSTAIMVRLGKVYDNLMVDVATSSMKLRNRALRLVMQLAPAQEHAARELLAQSGGSVKVAVVMARRQVDAQTARALLERHSGVLRTTLSS